MTQIPDDAKKPQDRKRSAKQVLLNKKRVQVTQPIKIGDEEIEITVRALSEREIHEIRTLHPPRKNNKKDEGMVFDSDTYPPAYLARAVIEPELSEEEWSQMWSSDDFSVGERSDLFGFAHSVSFKGLGIPFGGND